jgi:hypothetical protein
VDDQQQLGHKWGCSSKYQIANGMPADKKKQFQPGGHHAAAFYVSGFQPLKHVMTGVFVQVHKRLQPLFCLGALNGARLMNFWRQLGQVSHKLN